DQAGAITGNVATSLVTCVDPAAYVYSGDVTPSDVDISDPNHVNPVSTALVGLNSTSGLYNFTAGFLPAGDYTVAFTCEASQDVANQSNKLSFLRVLHTTVKPQDTVF